MPLGLFGVPERPGGEAEAVEGAQVRAVVDQALGGDVVAVGRQGALGDGDADLVVAPCALRPWPYPVAFHVQVPEVGVGVDAAQVLAQHLYEELLGVHGVAHVAPGDGLEDGVLLQLQAAEGFG